MILGIGTDIIEISRVEKAIANKRFLEKIFTINEIKLFSENKINSASGNFACKESAAKALGTGFLGFSPIDIEVLRDNGGKPIINLYNGALEKFYQLGGKYIHASISHCKEYATAVVIIEA